MQLLCLDLHFVAFGAMSKGRSINANANKVTVFRRRRAMINSSLSSQPWYSDVKGSIGKIFTRVLGALVYAFVWAIFSLYTSSVMALGMFSDLYK